jgi:peptide/nickel transport system permease protein
MIAESPSPPLVRAVPRGSAGPVRAAIHELRRNRSATLGGLLLLMVALLAVLAPYLMPFPPIRPAPAESLEPPSLRHLMGTDEIGRDIFSRVLAGAALSLQMGLISTAVSLVAGVALGLLAGYRAGWVGVVVMRTVDVMLAMPGLLLALAIVASLGPSFVNVMIGVGVAGIPRFTRVVRGCVLSARENAYVEAARVVGCGGLRISVRHILPNVFAPALVLATVYVGSAILTAASLSYLGMGAQPPTPEWGLMLSKGRDYLRTAWWISTFPGLAIMLTVLAINMLGDGLRDALDPRLRL